MRRRFLLWSLLAFGCDTFDDGDRDGFDPFGDSWDLSVLGSGFDDLDHAGVVRVALVHAGGGVVEARGASDVVDGRFVIFFDDELEDEDEYALHWWIDLDDDAACSPDEVSRLDFEADRDLAIRLTPRDLDGGGDCTAIVDAP